MDKLARELRAIEEAAASLDGDIAKVSFDPQDPQSIDLAIRAMEESVDKRLGDHQSSEMVRMIADSLKEKLREGILESASAASLAEGNDE